MDANLMGRAMRGVSLDSTIYADPKMIVREHSKQFVTVAQAHADAFLRRAIVDTADTIEFWRADAAERDGKDQVFDDMSRECVGVTYNLFARQEKLFKKEIELTKIVDAYAEVFPDAMCRSTAKKSLTSILGEFLANQTLIQKEPCWKEVKRYAKENIQRVCEEYISAGLINPLDLELVMADTRRLYRWN